MIFEVKDLRPPQVETLLDLPGVHLTEEQPHLAQLQPAVTSLRSLLPPVEGSLSLGPLKCCVCPPHSRFEAGEGTPEGLLDISLLDFGVLPAPALLGVHLLMPLLGQLLGLHLSLKVPLLEVPPDALLGTTDLPQSCSYQACPLPPIESDQVQRAPVCDLALGAPLHQHGLNAILLKGIGMVLDVPKGCLQELRPEPHRDSREGEEGPCPCLAFEMAGVEVRGGLRLGEPVREGRSQA